ncbi:MAG: hypothetical protein ACK5IB_01275 [Qingshengfaniella sp.]
MTALSKYQRLECPGIWRAEDGAQRRDVFVSLGEATLVIKDKADIALAHWSLPAVERMNPGGKPALYRPGADSEETLEIDEAEMIEAIGTVGRAVSRSRPRPGRLRLSVLALICLAIVALGAFWLPGALVRYTATIVPESTRQDIGRRILAELEPVVGRPCRAGETRQVLDALGTRLFGDAPWDIVVVPGGPVMTAHLPGGLLLIHRDMIETVPTPEVTAGALLVEAARADTTDAMADFMASAGAGVTLHLLTQGRVEDAAIARYATDVLTQAPLPPPDDRLTERFTAAAVSPQPYLDAARLTFDPKALEALHLDTQPVLSDTDWIRLQGICLR